MTARVYNVKDYGALGDGAANDTTAIQNALNDANTAGGGVVLVPPGTYIVTGLTLPSNITVQGSGNPTTTIQLKSGSNVSVIKSTSFDSLTGTTPGSLSGTTGWEIRDLLIDGNASGQTGSSTGLQVFAYRYVLHNVEIYNCKTDALYSEWVDNGAHTHGMEAFITNCRFTASGNNGVTWYGPHDSYFSNCFAIHNPNIGIFVGGLPSGGSGGSTTFTQCHSWGFNQQYAWKFTTSGACVNCESDGPVIAGVWVAGTNQFTWVGGLIYNPGNANLIGFKLGDAANNLSVSAILIDTLWSHPTGGAVVFDQPSAGGNTIRGTILTNDADRGGIHFVTGTTNETDQFDIITYGLSNGTLGAAAESLHQFVGPVIVDAGAGDTNGNLLQLKNNNSQKFAVNQFGQMSCLTMRVSAAVFASANSALFAVGLGTYSVATGGFNGSTAGTVYATNIPNGFAGDLINLQVANASTLNNYPGDSRFIVNGAGVVSLPQPPPATANNGLLNLGPGAFDGTTTGFFVGSSSGTKIAINSSAGFAGNFGDWQVQGSSKHSFDATGNAIHSGLLKITGGAHLSSGSGAPSKPNGVNPTAGDFYFRTDTPSTANQRIYVCTVGGATPTWVGIV